MRKKADDSSHLNRWLTALAALPILIAVIAFGPAWLVLVLVLAATATGLLELGHLLLPQTQSWIRVVTLGIGLALPLAAYLRGTMGLAAATIAVLFVNLSLFLLIYNKEKEILSLLGGSVFAQLYIAFALSHLLLLFQLPAGRRWIFFVLAVIFSGDTGAYYVGRQWGRHRLAPTLSPKKTVEGAAGGLICSLALALVGGKFLLSARINVGSMLTLALALAIVGQVGDLIESMLKRVSRVKDAGYLLPGHGGILDRLDSLLFAFPLTYYCARFLSSAGAGGP
jgi:phosphatidate cytidylyltransferase